jgi:hypothetical protein
MDAFVQSIPGINALCDYRDSCRTPQACRAPPAQPASGPCGQ